MVSWSTKEWSLVLSLVFVRILDPQLTQVKLIPTLMLRRRRVSGAELWRSNTWGQGEMCQSKVQRKTQKGWEGQERFLLFQISLYNPASFTELPPAPLAASLPLLRPASIWSQSLLFALCFQVTAYKLTDKEWRCLFFARSCLKFLFIGLKMPVWSVLKRFEAWEVFDGFCAWPSQKHSDKQRCWSRNTSKPCKLDDIFLACYLWSVSRRGTTWVVLLRSPVCCHAWGASMSKVRAQSAFEIQEIPSSWPLGLASIPHWVHFKFVLVGTWSFSCEANDL